MAENAPPAGTANAGPDHARGMPYYEKLRRDLRETLQKKRILDQSLAQLEESIQRVETSYLEETSAGNIIKGFDNYIKGSTGGSTLGGGGPGTATRRKAAISDTDRIFSRSSASFMREASTPASTNTTPHASTPTSSFPTRESSQPTANGNAAGKAAGSKKKKASERDDDDSESKPAKRGKITYGRD